MSGSEDGGVSSASFIGIIVAISGNVLISLALNCQKLAHHRLEEERQGAGHHHHATAEPHYSPIPTQSPDNLSGGEDDNGEDYDDDEHTRVGSSQQQSPNSDAESDINEADYGEPVPFPKYSRNGSRSPTHHKAQVALLELDALLPAEGSVSGCNKPKTYGSVVPEDYRPRSHSEPVLQTDVLLSSIKGKGKNTAVNGNETSRIESERRAERSGPARERSRSHSRLRIIEPPKPQDTNNHHESDYLKSKLWCVCMRARGSCAHILRLLGGWVSCL